MNLSVLFSQIMCFLLFLFSPCFSAGVSRLCLNPAFCPLVFLLGPLGKPSEDRDIPKSIDRAVRLPTKCAMWISMRDGYETSS
jgi:hypothetical protein